MYLKDPEPKERVENPPTSVWCQQKGVNNPYTHWNGICRGCCLYCKEKDCPHETCHQQRIRIGAHKGEHTCYYHCSPSEWMMGKIDDKARERLYKLRQIQAWLSRGIREDDGSWEGQMITRVRERYGKDFGREE